jgi:adenylate cyclase
MKKKPTPEEFWRDILTNHQPVLKYSRRLYHLLPSGPRCKLCDTPFGAPGSYAMRLIGRPRSRANSMLCDPCEGRLKDNVGGAEIEISMLFADVRGSTSLAEQMSASDFSALMSRFYTVASGELMRWNALIANPAGDQVSGFFYPALAGKDHAGAAIGAGLDLLRAIEREATSATALPVGIGVHTGIAYCGAAEVRAGVFEAVVLGDAVNTVARLSSAAAAGELLISKAAATAAGHDTTGLEQRELQLKGRDELVRVSVHRAATLAAAPA